MSRITYSEDRDGLEIEEQDGGDLSRKKTKEYLMQNQSDVDDGWNGNKNLGYNSYSLRGVDSVGGSDDQGPDANPCASGASTNSGIEEVVDSEDDDAISITRSSPSVGAGSDRDTQPDPPTRRVTIHGRKRNRQETMAIAVEEVDIIDVDELDEEMGRGDVNSVVQQASDGEGLSVATVRGASAGAETDSSIPSKQKKKKKQRKSKSKLSAKFGTAGNKNDVVILGVMVGVEAPVEVKEVAKKELSSWAQKFINPRMSKEPDVPEIAPLNDEFLSSFGRSYKETQAKGQAMKDAAGGAVEDKGDSGEIAPDDDDTDSEGNSEEDSVGQDRKSGYESPGEGNDIDRNNMDTPGKGVLAGGGMSVSNLPFNMCEEKILTKTFAVFGEVVSMKVGKWTDTITGKVMPSGRATVFFKNRKDAAMAVDMVNGETLLGREIRAVQYKTLKKEVPRYFINPDAKVETAKVPQCNNCKAKGHWENACPQTPFCILCAESGHTEEGCPHSACLVCMEFGHSTEECTEDRATTPVVELCFICGAVGHTAETCPSKVSSDGTPVENVCPNARCVACGKKGHTCCASMDYMIVGGEVRGMHGNMVTGTCENCGRSWHNGAICPEKRFDSSELQGGGRRHVSKFARSNGSGRQSKFDRGKRLSGQGQGDNRGRSLIRQCYNCGDTGHEIALCPQRRARTPGPPVRHQRSMRDWDSDRYVGKV
ncbi:unnamed protein product [Choristocarpus tenellus]